jgi:hypothetical protein
MLKIIVTVTALVLTFVLYPSITVAGTAIQTDWSGGDGIWGPVTDWGNEFYLYMGIDCYGNPSDLTLQHVILQNTVSGSFVGASSVYSADINGDGCMDVLGAAVFDDKITWWENQDGSGTSWTEYTVDGAFDYAQSVYSADINGDGYMDVLGAAFDANDITWWENVDGSGTSWTKNTVDDAFNGASSVYSADINGNGYMDILGAGFDNDDITWWENTDGSGTSWTENIVDWGFYGASSVYSADINGDGYMDVLGAAYYAGCITWWENKDGSGTSWTEHTVDMDYYGARSVYSADINGDGCMDILGAGFVDDDITWWENVDGSGTSWTKHTVDGYFNGASSVCSADMNGDGHMDVLGAALYADDITWWENVDGSGTSWTEHTVDDNFNGARSVCSADINGDGYLDVLGAAVCGDDITWWDLTAYLSDGSLESSVLDVQESPDWQTIDWTCSEPTFTNISFQVRASDNSSNMGEWSNILTLPGSLDGILTDGDSLFQYRVILATTDSHSTPVLDNVTVTWNLTGIEGESGDETYALYGVKPNPSISSAILVLSLPVDSRVELTVYDLTGRMVISVCGEYESGVHEVILDNLACGMYMVRMTSEEFTATQRFVMIE